MTIKGKEVSEVRNAQKWPKKNINNRKKKGGGEEKK